MYFYFSMEERELFIFPLPCPKDGGGGHTPIPPYLTSWYLSKNVGRTHSDLSSVLVHFDIENEFPLPPILISPFYPEITWKRVVWSSVYVKWHTFSLPPHLSLSRINVFIVYGFGYKNRGIFVAAKIAYEAALDLAQALDMVADFQAYNNCCDPAPLYRESIESLRQSLDLAAMQGVCVCVCVLITV